MDQPKITKNIRIAKNTLFLYLRQIIVILISLYTVRAILNTLGSTDYGIYNIIGGVVVLFSYVNSSLASATQRFLNFALGEENLQKANVYFSSSLILHFLLALSFLLFAETLGLNILIQKMNIPVERIDSTIFAYHFAILTTVFDILRIPYYATIIAYEKMSFFAWLSIVEVMLKLLIIFILKCFIFDKLMLYSILLSVISFSITLIYKEYCHKSFTITHFNKFEGVNTLKELIVFSGWNLLGSTANVCNTQGVNLSLNITNNVILNAANAIANQVNGAVYSFVANFQTAFNPLLIKSFASGDFNYFYFLLNASSKYSFFLLYFFILPFIFNADYILSIWLVEIPEHASSFVKLILIWSLIDVFNNPLYTCIQATGEIKQYNIVVSLFKLMPLPVIVYLLSKGYTPNIVYYVEIIFSLIIDTWRIFYCHSRINLNLKYYFKNILLKCFYIAITTSSLVYCISISIGHYSTFNKFILTSFTCVFINSICFYFIGFNKKEKEWLFKILNKILRSIKWVK